MRQSSNWISAYGGPNRLWGGPCRGLLARAGARGGGKSAMRVTPTVNDGAQSLLLTTFSLNRYCSNGHQHAKRHKHHNVDHNPDAP